MTPDQAKELLAFGAALPARKRRYELEGGTNQAWKCPACNWHAIGHSEIEAKRSLARSDDPRSKLCPHAKMVPTGNFMPPEDFR